MPRTADLTGQRFGILTAVKPTTQRSGHAVVWSCRCDCGARVLRSTRVLAPRLAAKPQSCGCINRGRASPFALDLVGARFGRLTVVAYDGRDEVQGLRWRCACDCGGESVARGKDLRLGTTTSCGCARGAGAAASRKGAPWRAATMGRGDRFGMLVIQDQASIENGSRHYLCRCDCGGQTIVRSGLLRSGQTKSCGCLRRRAAAHENRSRGISAAGSTADSLRAPTEFRLSLNGEPPRRKLTRQECA